MFLILIIVIVIIAVLINKFVYTKPVYKTGGNSQTFEKKYYGFNYDMLKKQFAKDRLTNSRNYLLTTINFDTGSDNRAVMIQYEDDRLIFTLTEDYGKESAKDYVVNTNISEYERIADEVRKKGYTKFFAIQSYREVYQKVYTKIIFEHFPGCDPFIIIQSDPSQLVDAYAEKYNLKENKDISSQMLWKEQGINYNKESFKFTSLIEDNDICNKKEFRLKVLKQIDKFNI